MIIAIDASRISRQFKTGPEWYSYFIIKELKRFFPATVKVVLYTDQKLTNQLGQLPPNWQEIVLSWPLPLLWTQLRLAWQVILRPPDILFCPAQAPPFLAILWRPKIKLVTTLHDFGFWHIPQAYPLKERLYHRFITWFNVHLASRLITPSQFTRQDLIDHYNFAAQKTRVAYLGQGQEELRRFKKQSGLKVLSKYNITLPYILYIGRLEHKKNIINLVKAYELVRQKNFQGKLVLIGKRGFGYLDIIKSIEESSWRQDIKLLAYVNSQDLHYILTQAKIFVLPSLFEGFGLAAVEAMAVGVPVVTSLVGSLPEVIDGAGLFFKPTDPQDLADKILTITNIPKQRELLISQGQQRVKKYSWQQCASTTWEIISELSRHKK